VKKLICLNLIFAPAVVIGFNYLLSGRFYYQILLPSIVATVGYTVFVMVCRAANLTIFNPVDILGSFFGNEPSFKTKTLGSIGHYMTGFLLAMVGKILLTLVNQDLNTFSGALWGLLASFVALGFFSTIQSVHPRMKKGLTPAPGFLALNYGRPSPIVIILGHIIYGALLGITVNILHLNSF